MKNKKVKEKKIACLHNQDSWDERMTVEAACERHTSQLINVRAVITGAAAGATDAAFAEWIDVHCVRCGRLEYTLANATQNIVYFQLVIIDRRYASLCQLLMIYFT